MRDYEEVPNLLKFQIYFKQPYSCQSKRRTTLTFTNYCCNCSKGIKTRYREIQIKNKISKIPWKVLEAKTIEEDPHPNSRDQLIPHYNGEQNYFDYHQNHQNFPSEISEFKRRHHQQQQHHHQQQQEEQKQQPQQHYRRQDHSTATSKRKIWSSLVFPRFFSHSRNVFLVFNFFSHLLTLLLMALLLLTQMEMLRVDCQQILTSTTTTAAAAAATTTIGTAKAAEAAVAAAETITTSKEETTNSILLPQNIHKWAFKYINQSTFGEDKIKNKSKREELMMPKQTKINEFTWRSSNSTDSGTTLQAPNSIWLNRNGVNLNDTKLLRLVMDGLGLKKLPDMKKINISQAEYASKYNEYLRLQYKRQRREVSSDQIVKNAWRNYDNNFAPTDIDEIDVGVNVPELELQFVSLQSNATISSRDFENDDNWFLSIPRAKREALSSTHRRRFIKSINDNINDKTKTKTRTKMLLRFSMEQPQFSAFQSNDIEEANLRLMIVYKRKKTKGSRKNCKDQGDHYYNNNKNYNNNNKRYDNQNELELNIYQRLSSDKRIWLDIQKIEGIDETNDTTMSQWLEFDVTSAVKSWLIQESNDNNNFNSVKNLKFEVHCDNCKRFGARIVNDAGLDSVSENHDSSIDESNRIAPVLNIIGRTQRRSINQIKTNDQRTLKNIEKSEQSFPGSCPSTDSNKHPRCCRHVMQVAFKEIKGFEFIIQPKTFDAGFCFGRCPPRYNPAHHHAMLQSLVWKQYKGAKVPRPCCAPSKLVELQVLHVDEEDSKKLKISTWTDMRVVECACS